MSLGADAVARDWCKVEKHAREVAGRMWTAYSERLTVWQDVADVFYPVGLPGLRSGFSDERLAVVPESSSALATRYPQEVMRKGASGFSINLTSPAKPWFRLTAGVDVSGGDRDGRAKATRALDALTRAERIVLDVSGVYQALNKLYEHLLTFGTACLLVMPSRNPSGYRFVDATTLRFGTFALGIGADGMVNSVVRRYRWTVNQIVEAYGLEVCPERVRAVWESGKGGSQSYVLSTLIEPNTVRELIEACGFELEDEFPYRTITLCDWGRGKVDNGVVEVAGLRHNPIIAPRLEFELGDIWGRGRGEDALPNARLLCALREDDINVSGNHADPALFVSSDLQGTGVNLDRGSINYADLRSGAVSVPAVPNPGNLQYNDQVGQEIREELSETFFVSRFATIDALKLRPGVKTATEIEQLVRENMGLLGPVITNLDRELLDPLVSVVAQYTLDEASRNGIPLDDFEALGGGVKIEYLSAMHRAQRADDIQAIQQTINFLGMVAQGGKPEALDLVDIDALARGFFENVGLPEQYLKLPKEVEAVRAQRAQMQEQMMKLQQAQAAAQAARDAGIGAQGFGSAMANGNGAGLAQLAGAGGLENNG